ncbi:MAG: hypothetical protein AVDCRST_MAG23-1710, partial [uncultured Sphingosinicella sp.]
GRQGPSAPRERRSAPQRDPGGSRRRKGKGRGGAPSRLARPDRRQPRRRALSLRRPGTWPWGQGTPKV